MGLGEKYFLDAVLGGSCLGKVCSVVGLAFVQKRVKIDQKWLKMTKDGQSEKMGL